MKNLDLLLFRVGAFISIHAATLIKSVIAFIVLFFTVVYLAGYFVA